MVIFTTQTAKHVGLGIPFFKQAAELAKGSFSLNSQIGVGTTVIARFLLDSIDRMPLGDINSTVLTLIRCNPKIDVRFTFSIDEHQFCFNTSEVRDMLGDFSLDTPEVLTFLKEYLEEHTSNLLALIGEDVAL